MNIVWSPLAMARTTEISEYIARDNPAAAVKWVETLFGKVELLAASPESGRMSAAT